MFDNRDAGNTPNDDQQTRPYDFSSHPGEGREDMPSLPPVGSGWNASAPNSEHSTDELDMTRPVRTTAADDVYAPPAASAQRADFDDAPTRVAPVVAPSPGVDPSVQERDRRTAPPRDATADYGLDAPVARLQAADRGATTAGRLLSLVFSLLILGILGFIGWDLSRGGDSVIGNALVRSGHTPTVILIETVGAVSLLLFLLGLTLGWSGLGLGISGAILTVLGLTMTVINLNSGSANSNSFAALGDALGAAAWSALIPFGLLLAAAGVGAHFARRGGMKRAINILSGRVD